MEVTNKSTALKTMEDNEVDFGLVSVLPEKLRVEEEILLENKLYLVGNREHALEQGQYSQDIFNKLPMIYREQGSATRNIMEGFFERSKIIVSKKIELTSNEAVKQAVIAGLGYSIMPLIGLRSEIKSGEIKILPTEGFPIRSQWRLIWLENKKLSPISMAYLAYLRENKYDIINDSFSWINTVNSQ